jgi:hypothetical protein
MRHKVIENLFDNIKFNTVNSNAKFVKIDNNIKNKFITFIDNLEKDSSVILCTRGDSYKSKQMTSAIILRDVFLVGQKVRTHSSNDCILNKYNKTYKNKNKSELIQDITDLIKELNNNIKCYPYKEKPLSGSFNQHIIDNLTDISLDINILNNHKYFLLAFLHNTYKNSIFNRNTPFISLAHGKDKYNIANKFALGFDKDNNNYTKKNGYIFLYCLPCESQLDEYVVTSNLGDAISQMGIQNYEDKYSEIILTNGMYPHFLFGIFRIINYKIDRFTINPALVHLLDNKQKFNYQEGLKIDQTDLKKQALQLGYTSYSKIIDGKTHIFKFGK